MPPPITREKVDNEEESNPRTPEFGDECREFVEKFVKKHGEDLGGVLTSTDEETRS